MENIRIAINRLSYWSPQITNIAPAFNLGILAGQIFNAQTTKPQHTETRRNLSKSQYTICSNPKFISLYHISWQVCHEIGVWNRFVNKSKRLMFNFRRPHHRPVDNTSNESKSITRFQPLGINLELQYLESICK